MRTVKINIDLDKVSNIMQSGVNRAAYFLGLGLNALSNPDLKSADLLPFTSYNFGGKDLDEDSINSIKNAFKKWLVSNCLRDLMESFALYCDSIVEIIIYINSHGNTVVMEDILTQYKRLTKKGIKEKIQYMKKDISIDNEETTIIFSINNARNCMVHNRGVVGGKYCNQGNKLKLQWIGLRTYLELDGKHKVPVDNRIIERNKINGEITGASVIYEKKEKLFEEGSVIDISPQELADICLFFSATSEKIKKSLRDYIKSRGITIVNKQDTRGVNDS